MEDINSQCKLVQAITRPHRIIIYTLDVQIQKTQIERNRANSTFIEFNAMTRTPNLTEINQPCDRKCRTSTISPNNQPKTWSFLRDFKRMYFLFNMLIVTVPAKERISFNSCLHIDLVQTIRIMQVHSYFRFQSSKCYNNALRINFEQRLLTLEHILLNVWKISLVNLSIRVAR